MHGGSSWCCPGLPAIPLTHSLPPLVPPELQPTLQVQPNDNVEVGHVVASIGPLGAAAAAAPPPQPAAPQQEAAAAPAAPAPKKKAAPKKAAAAAPKAAAPAAAHAPRTPAIRFPPRVAPGGEQISTLPREQAAQLLAGLVSGAGEAQQAQRAPAPEPSEYVHMIAVPIVGGSMPTLRGMAVPSGPPGPARRLMSDAEMEAIMLGGAEP